jgi:hypothetical protein
MNARQSLKPPVGGLWTAAACLGLCALVLTGCSVAAPFSAAPKLRQSAHRSGPAAQTRVYLASREAPPEEVMTHVPVQQSLQQAPLALSTSGGTALAEGAGQPNHRQYFDASRKRFYYFDPVLRQYLWEDGTPR